MNLYNNLIVIIACSSLIACNQQYSPSPIHSKITKKHYDKLDKVYQEYQDNDSNYYLHHTYQSPERNIPNNRNAIRNNNIPAQPYPMDNDSMYTPYRNSYGSQYQQNNNYDSSTQQQQYPADNDTNYQLFYDE